jgi:cell division protease FtsH
MSDKFGLMGLESQENQYLTGRAVLNCGDATAAEIDQEVMKILKDSYDEAIRLLSDNKDAMDQIAAFLIDKETITGKEFMKIFRRVKGIPEPEEPKEDDEARLRRSFMQTRKPRLTGESGRIRQNRPIRRSR